MQSLPVTIFAPLGVATTNNIQITPAPPQKPNGEIFFDIDSETFTATNVTGDGPYTLVGVIRGQNGTTPAVHAAGTATMRFSSESDSEIETAVTGSTSGTATFSQPEQGASDKKVVIYLNALLGTAAYVFPTPFRHAPTAIGAKSATATTITTTGVTVTGSTDTGFLELIGD